MPYFNKPEFLAYLGLTRSLWIYVTSFDSLWIHFFKTYILIIMLVIFGDAWVTKLLYTYLTKVTHVTKIFIIFLLRNKMKLSKKNKLNLYFFGNKLYTNSFILFYFILFLFLTIIYKKKIQQWCKTIKLLRTWLFLTIILILLYLFLKESLSYIIILVYDDV